MEKEAATRQTPKSFIGGEWASGMGLGPSLHSLFIGTASGVLRLHHVRKLGWAREGLDAQGLKGIICPEGQPHCGWGLWPCCLAGEATFAQSFAVIEELVIRRPGLHERQREEGGESRSRRSQGP